MVTILTLEGISLDLHLSGSFEIEYNQPLLDTEAMPVPYSTSIGFLPTRKNCDRFGYVPAMMLPPQNDNIMVDIYISGIKIMSGILIYESIEDGIINYTFTAKDSIEKLENKDIADSKFLPLITLRSPSFEYERIRDNRDEIIKAPLLINKNVTVSMLDEGTESIDALLSRYHNYPYNYETVFTPAVRLYDFLIDEFGASFNIDKSIIEDLKKVYLLCPYKPKPTTAKNGFGVVIPVKDTLPALNKLDLFKNIARIFGAAYYRDGDSFSLLNSSNVLTSDEVIDWSNKVSDYFSTRPEPPMTYRFNFNDDSSDNVYDPVNLKGDLEDGDIVSADSYNDMVFSAKTNGEYSTILHKPTGDIYSLAAGLTNASAGVWHGSTLVLADSVLRVCNNVDNTLPEDENIFDNSVSLSLPRLIPDLTLNVSKLEYKVLVAPLINPPAIGEERGNLAIVGIIGYGQMTDKGYVSVFHKIQGGIPFFTDEFQGFSLDPKALYQKYHTRFADWLHKKRQVVSLDLNLSIADIASFRMYRKVYFAGRAWLPITFSVTVNMETGNITTSGEFVEI